MPQFCYSPLETNQIRLLTIHPSTDLAKPILCDLSIVNLHENLKYTALSYAWGAREPRSDIRVGEFEFFVTPSLASALRYLRDPNEAKVFWIDGICINQSDNSEKIAQLSLMGDIYYGADVVVVWLGPHAGESRQAILLLKEWEEIVWDCGINDVATFMEKMMDEQLVKPLQRTIIRGGDEAFGGVNQLIRRAWWTRIWTVQEFLLARKVIFKCEAAEFGFLALLPRFLLRGDLGFTRTLIECGGEQEEYGPSACGVEISSMVCLRSISESMVKGGDRPSFENILILMSLFMRRLATDPRDKIYGVLGMLPDLNILSRAKLDYVDTTEATYLKFAQCMVQQQHFPQLCILASAGIGYLGSHHRLAIPSWVPDWRSEVLDSFPVPLPKHTYSAGTTALGTSPIRGPDVAMVCTTGELLILGKTVGRVLSVFGPDNGWGKPGRDYDQLGADWQNFLFNNPKFSFPPSGFAPGIPLLQAFWRTITGDLDPLNRGVRVRLMPLQTEYHFILIASFLLTVKARNECAENVDRLDQLLQAGDISEEAGLGTFFDQEQHEGSLQWPDDFDILQALDRGFIIHHYPLLPNRSLFVIVGESRFLGIRPPLMQEGDEVVVPIGSEVPLVLRKREGEDGHILVGECFVLGCMFGEFLESCVERTLPLEVWVLH